MPIPAGSPRSFRPKHWGDPLLSMKLKTPMQSVLTLQDLIHAVMSLALKRRAPLRKAVVKRRRLLLTESKTRFTRPASVVDACDQMSMSTLAHKGEIHIMVRYAAANKPGVLEARRLQCRLKGSQTGSHSLATGTERKETKRGRQGDLEGEGN